MIVPVFAMAVFASAGGVAAPVAQTAPSRPQGPCDLYNAAGTPCVTAHSTTRLLLSTYAGPLYRVERRSDGRVLDIGVARPAAYADAAAQDRFCVDTLCVITVI